MNKLEAKNTIYNDPRYDVVIDSRMLEKHLKEKDQQITDLQSQLAIAEKALELACSEELREIGIYDDSLDYKKELSISKQQYLEQAKKFNNEAQKYYEDAYCNDFQNQKAIRELEKVKNFLLEKIAEKQSCFDSRNYNDFADGVKTICELILISIDNQIKSLKGEK